MAFQSTENFYKVEAGVIISQIGPRPPFGDDSSDATLARHGWYRLWVDDGGANPGRFFDKVRGLPVVDTPNERVTRIDVWVERAAGDKRRTLESNIESERRAAEESMIDVRADPGLNGMMDEANASAQQKREELGATPDQDLDSFDETLDPRSPDSVQLAASLSYQERALLAAANPFTAQQQTDLEAAAVEHEAIVSAGDPAADVPEVPSFARRMVGVMGEEYGWLRAHRIFVNPWYWLEVELDIERDLDAENYFLVVYDETAPDDRDDTVTAYLSTAQFTALEPGKFIATKEAINLPRAIDFGYKLTVAKGHISQPQFDRVLFAGGKMFREYRVRWGGLTL